ncbi:hypothetical protein SOVF_033560 [Spinacia oleracea]|uniref:Uncharacterized protein isoform X1 n=1 Tax=Spinacia oleracea TaxID=3562 RepID=A0A9R0HT07_SPIOL|nr:uncharacterized protein LOC110776224 isoform X1 [Spinacia oleracea]XP_021836467.2 uncharacterized protein LOC110776224 isoform X1 [Spinacia oleracea]KNA22510.1 hypothetical protein SOVF_033560 [Spinacia oleracea]
MAAATSSSLKEYLKKYESNSAAEEKKKKKKKKTKAVAAGVLVVDEDPVWQKQVNLEEDEENDSPDEKPQVDEDIEVKRMKRLEQLRARRSYNEISEDGSGWVPISDTPMDSTNLDSSPRNRKARYDPPSPEHGMDASDSGRKELTDLSPPRQRRQRNDSPSPGPNGLGREGSDLSPPRQRQNLNDFPSSKHVTESSAAIEEVDLSPPRQRRRRYDSPSPERRTKASNAEDSDMSPPRRRGQVHGSLSPMPQKNSSVSGVRDFDMDDLSPPRRERRGSSKINDSRVSEDLSPPRKSQKGIDKRGGRENSVRGRSIEPDLSPPRKSKEQKKTGLITGKDVSTEIAKIKKDEWSRFNEMDPSTSGRGAVPVYRFKGERISKDEYLKLTKKEEKPKKEEKKLEWGKGLAQKREAEARLLELELEKEKPFARSRDDPELDIMMKDRPRWGDPMLHLVKKKQSDLLLSDLGDNEKMRESGFIIPQDRPTHSWLNRGVDYEPNRYGIKPGRHWDGVNRSTGYEKQLVKRTNEKRATEREAYLWSVADM